MEEAVFLTEQKLYFVKTAQDTIRMMNKSRQKRKIKKKDRMEEKRGFFHYIGLMLRERDVSEYEEDK